MMLHQGQTYTLYSEIFLVCLDYSGFLLADVLCPISEKVFSEQWRWVYNNSS